MFGEREDGTPFLDVDGHVELTGVSAGSTSLRVIDPATGELYDRMTITVVELDDARLVPVGGRPLLAGCTSSVGIELFGGEVRAADDRATATIEGPARLEQTSWDLVRLTPGAGATELTLRLHAGGQDFERTLLVNTLEAEGLTTCPVVE